MPVGLYRIPRKDAENLGYTDAYIMAEYEIKGDKIIIGRSVYDFDENNLIKVEPADFVDLSGRPMNEAKKLFEKYGADVDFVFAIRTRKGANTKLVALIGGKTKK